MAIRIDDGAIPWRNRGTSFGDLDDVHNDESTWRLALSTMQPLKIREIVARRPDLQPFGDYGAIKRAIQYKLDRVKEWNGGSLPRVYYVEVPGMPVNLTLPADIASPALTAVFEVAASRGVEAFESVSNIITTVANEAKDQQAVEADIRAQIRAEEDWQNADDDQIEEEVGNRLRLTGTSDEDTPSEAEARRLMRGFFAEENPGASEAELDEMVETRIEANERAGKGSTAGSRTARAAQTAGMITGIASSMVDVVSTALDSNTELPIDTAVTVLNAIGAVCSIAGTALTSVPIAGAVLQILALIVNIIAAILDAVREYTITPEEGINAEWDSDDLEHILTGRLTALCQCDPRVVAENIIASTSGTPAVRANPGRKKDFLKQWVYDTALNRGDSRFEAAQSICTYLGGSGDSYRWVTEIRAWLLYVGLKEADVQDFYDWLFEARQATEVVALQNRIWAARDTNYGYLSNGYTEGWMDNAQVFCTTGPRTCRSYGPEKESGKWWQCPCDENDPGSSGLASHMDGHECAGSSSARPNLWKGSREWYQICQGVEFTNFTLDDLDRLHKWLLTELRVVAVSQGELENVADRVADAYDRGGWDVGGIIGGKDNFRRFMDLLPVRRVMVDGFECYAGRGLAVDDFWSWTPIFKGFRDPLRWGNPGLVSIIVDGVAWKVAIRRPPTIGREQTIRRKSGVKPELQAEFNALSRDDRIQLLGSVAGPPIGGRRRGDWFDYETATIIGLDDDGLDLGAEGVATVTSAGFLDRLTRAVKSAAGGVSLGTIGVVAGVAAAGVAAALLIKR